MFDLIVRAFYGEYLDEIMLRTGDDYDPYHYIDEGEMPASYSDEELEEFDWSEEE